MEKLVEFLKSFLAIILIFIAFGFVNAYLALESTSKLVSKDNITNIIKETDFSELIGEESKQELYNDLEEAGIPKESVDAVLENEKFQEIIGGIISESFTAIVEDKELPTIDEKQLSKDLIEIFDSVVEETNMDISKKEINEVHQNIKENVSEIAKEMNNSSISLDDLIDEDELDNEDANITVRDGIKVVQKVYKNRIWFLVVAIVLLGCVVLLKLKDLRFLKWIGSTMISYAIFFIMIGKAASVLWDEFIVKELSEFKTLLTTSFNSMIRTYYIAGIVFFIIGVCLIVAKPLYNKYKEKNEITNETI